MYHKTSTNICGGMKAVNWLTIKQNWKHMKGKHIDILLGADHHELMHTMKEVVGANDEPIARLSLGMDSNWNDRAEGGCWETSHWV